MVVILVEEEKMREMLVVVPRVMVMFLGYDIRGDVGCYLRVLSVMGWGNMGMKYTQKAVGIAGGFALVVMSPMPVGKQVFLLGIGAVMRCMTPAMTTVKKAAVGGKKSPAGTGRKTADWEKPLPGPPQGVGAHSCCVLGGCVERPPLGEGWGGAFSGLGWGFRFIRTPAPWSGGDGVLRCG